ncbi:hypothetical protein HPB50_020692 [Hyalomma asiaticum]|uniref:Uncharacterized protein n=1 Tax=Hyalomma asiaticum TaxID=266040 RepID=A0ACB7S819_HYAAI|nr:hypothetical protein HPB50_020692 [Hyalomma asiaticum]
MPSPTPTRWQLAKVSDASALGGQVIGKMLLRALVTTTPEAHFEAYGVVRNSTHRRVDFVQRLDWYSNQTTCLPPSRWQKFCKCASIKPTNEVTPLANSTPHEAPMIT